MLNFERIRRSGHCLHKPILKNRTRPVSGVSRSRQGIDKRIRVYGVRPGIRLDFDVLSIPLKEIGDLPMSAKLST